jgi:hypothetical protein
MRDVCPELVALLSFPSWSSSEGDLADARVGQLHSFLQRGPDARHGQHTPPCAHHAGAFPS